MSSTLEVGLSILLSTSSSGESGVCNKLKISNNSAQKASALARGGGKCKGF